MARVVPIFVIAASLLASTAWAQAEKKAAANEGKAAAKADDAGAKKVAKKEPKGRLPAHYGAVVNDEQREKIYAINNRYAEQIKPLAAQVKDLNAKRRAEIEAVLTPDQLKEIQRLSDESKSKREKKVSEAKSDSPTAAAAPAAKPAKLVQ